MDIKFDKEYLSELYYKGKCSDKKYRFQPEVVRKYKQRIALLEQLVRVEQLYQYHSLNYEVLSGDKAGISSIRVDLKYRIEFIASSTPDSETLTICNILELSNHYK